MQSDTDTPETSDLILEYGKSVAQMTTRAPIWEKMKTMERERNEARKQAHPMPSTPTPETDELLVNYPETRANAIIAVIIAREHAKRLEKERDEARAMLKRIATRGQFFDMEGLRGVVSDWLAYRHISFPNV